MSPNSREETAKQWRGAGTLVRMIASVPLWAVVLGMFVWGWPDRTLLWCMSGAHACMLFAWFCADRAYEKLSGK